MHLKFRTLVKLHENRIYSLAIYLLREPGAAEDVTQETFMKLWENIIEIDLLNARAWLSRVARNLCFDRHRKHGLTKTNLENMLNQSMAQSPEELLDQNQRQDLLMDAIAALTEPYRSLVILRDIHQNSYREIAEILELNAAQVKVYLHRARQQLRNLLHKLEYEP